jgi:hypothetical protein
MIVSIRSLHGLLALFVAIAANGSAQEDPSVPVPPPAVISLGGSYGGAFADAIVDLSPNFTGDPGINCSQIGAFMEVEYHPSQILALIADVGYHRLTLRQESWVESRDPWDRGDDVSHSAWSDETWCVAAGFALRIRTSARGQVAATVDLGGDYRYVPDRPEFNSILPRLTLGLSIRPARSVSSIRLYGGSAHGGMVIGLEYGMGLGGMFP